MVNDIKPGTQELSTVYYGEIPRIAESAGTCPAVGSVSTHHCYASPWKGEAPPALGLFKCGLVLFSQHSVRTECGDLHRACTERLSCSMQDVEVRSACT